ncbi:hypothetical protein [Duganella aceris]|uniref:Carboxypeptidase regulatory-like domain-containing protein n=1 Tax=Duganella aceris TaxID=2703883 RepID=A0ABX0FP70_9BURK|nr:hypothetical protein [Duganella aceris]NGZ86418.1 hypothetical protein [Duganella aceris]
MIQPVVANTAAGLPHPSDPTLKIPMVSVVGADGMPTGPNVVTDTTGQFAFDLSSLASAPHYDVAGNMDYVTYGPDRNGRSIRQTSTWMNGVWMGDSGWVLV